MTDVSAGSTKMTLREFSRIVVVAAGMLGGIFTGTWVLSAKITHIDETLSSQAARIEELEKQLMIEDDKLTIETLKTARIEMLVESSHKMLKGEE